LPAASVTLYDAPGRQDVSADPRPALSLGSVQLLQRLKAWPAASAQPITEVHVSQLGAAPGLAFGARPELRIRADEESVAMLGAVLSYGALVAPMQRVWEQRCALEPQRLSSRFGVPVAALKPLTSTVEIDAGIAEAFDLVVIAEGGVFAEQSRKALVHDYRQTAWVGSAGIARGIAGLAVERFTRNGRSHCCRCCPSGRRCARRLVWCVPVHDDPVRDLTTDNASRC
jgi:2-octaprenyl-6-methoxyphenol hydroxylase